MDTDNGWFRPQERLPAERVPVLMLWEQWADCNVAVGMIIAGRWRSPNDHVLTGETATPDYWTSIPTWPESVLDRITSHISERQREEDVCKDAVNKLLPEERRAIRANADFVKSII